MLFVLDGSAAMNDCRMLAGVIVSSQYCASPIVLRADASCELSIAAGSVELDMRPLEVTPVWMELHADAAMIFWYRPIRFLSTKERVHSR